VSYNNLRVDLSYFLSFLFSSSLLISFLFNWHIYSSISISS